MDEISDNNNQQFVGVKIDEEGKPNFSSAMVALTSEEANMRVQEIHFQNSIQEAEEIGLTEDRLRALTMTLSSSDNDRPMRRKVIIETEGRKLGVTGEEILNYVRVYKKEKVKLTEKGPLNHYHQTTFNRFRNITQMKGVLSYNMLKEVEKEPK